MRVSVELVLPALRSISAGSLSAWYPAPLPQVQSVKAVALAGGKACEILLEQLFVSGTSHLRAGLEPQTQIAKVGGVGDGWWAGAVRESAPAPGSATDPGSA